jgi:hypothetical protein
MDSLSAGIKIFVQNFLNKASKNVAEKFDISQEEAMDIWKDLYNDLETIPSCKIKSSSHKKERKPRAKKEEKQEENEHSGGCCVHLLSRGPRIGEECGNKIHKNSQTGKYCTIHIKLENKAHKEVKKSKKKEKSNVEIAIKKDSNYGRYVHTSTGLVFKSPTEKIIIGRQDENGNLLKLTNEDIENCKKHRFVYDKTCVEDKHDNSDEENSDNENNKDENNKDETSESELSENDE